jgi:phosphonate transport system permease protein
MLVPAPAIPHLQDSQVAALSAAYRSAQAAKRRITLIGVLVLAVMIVVAGRVAEVDLAKLWANAGQLTSDFGRIFHLDNGQLVFTVIADWYWGLARWLSRL